MKYSRSLMEKIQMGDDIKMISDALNKLSLSLSKLVNSPYDDEKTLLEKRNQMWKEYNADKDK